jgi:hypothetical protein
MIYDVSAAEREIILRGQEKKKKRKAGLPKDWRSRILK